MEPQVKAVRRIEYERRVDGGQNTIVLEEHIILSLISEQNQQPVKEDKGKIVRRYIKFRSSEMPPALEVAYSRRAELPKQQHPFYVEPYIFQKGAFSPQYPFLYPNGRHLEIRVKCTSRELNPLHFTDLCLEDGDEKIYNAWIGLAADQNLFTAKNHHLRIMLMKNGIKFKDGELSEAATEKASVQFHTGANRYKHYCEEILNAL